MTIPQLLADLVSNGQLSRALEERDAARGNVRALHRLVGADIPVEDHARALELLGAVLARFREEPAVVRDEARERVQSARAGRTLVEHWRAEHERLRAQLASDRRDLDASQQRRQEVSSG